jgi:phage shock protein PspC (stress-responsive transcriptional regulator)
MRQRGAWTHAEAMNTSVFDTDADNGAASSAPPSAPSAGRRPLRRAYHGRMLAGVAAGIGDYLDVDVTIIRVAFVVFAALGGAGIPAYLACLLLIPEEGSDVSLASSLLDSLHRPSREV